MNRFCAITFLLFAVSFAIGPLLEATIDDLNKPENRSNVAAIMHYGPSKDVDTFYNALRGSLADHLRPFSVDVRSEANASHETRLTITLGEGSAHINVPLGATVEATREIINDVYTLAAEEADYAYLEEFKSPEDVVMTWMENKKPVLVMHKATWCGHCNAAKPGIAVAAKHSPHARYMTVECPDNSEYCHDNGADSYPTIMVFNGDWIEYPGHDRSAYAIKKFVDAIAAKKPAKFTGKLTRNGPKMIVPDNYVDPLADVAGDWKEVTEGQMKYIKGARLVVFTDSRDKSTHAAVRDIARASQTLAGEGWEHKVYRIEKRRWNGKGDSFFTSKTKLPVVFVVGTAEDASPVRVPSPTTFDAIVERVREVNTVPDFSRLIENPSAKRLSDVVRETGRPALVVLKATWCGHCKALHPQLARASFLTKSPIVEITCDEEKADNKEICGMMRVNSYPTLKAWTGRRWLEFDGDNSDRTPRAIAKWIDGVEAVESSMVDKDALIRLKAQRKLAERSVKKDSTSELLKKINSL